MGLLRRAQPSHALEIEHASDVPRERQLVALHQYLVGGYRRDRPRVALDLNQEDPGEVSELALLHGPAREGALGLDDHLDRELAGVGGERLRGGLSARHQPSTREKKEEQAGERDGRADRADLEQAQGLVTGLLQQPGDHHVGGGPDQRHEPTDDRGEADRHQVQGGGAAGAAGPRGDPGGDHRHDGGVVQEPGRRRGRGQDPKKRAPVPRRPRRDSSKDSPGHQLQGPGLLRRRGEHVQRGDRYGGLVREPLERLCRIDHPGDHERGDRAQDHGRRGVALRHEERDRRDHRGEREPRVGGHGGRLFCGQVAAPVPAHRTTSHARPSGCRSRLARPTQSCAAVRLAEAPPTPQAERLGEFRRRLHDLKTWSCDGCAERALPAATTSMAIADVIVEQVLKE